MPTDRVNIEDQVAAAKGSVSAALSELSELIILIKSTRRIIRTDKTPKRHSARPGLFSLLLSVPWSASTCRAVRVSTGGNGWRFSQTLKTLGLNWQWRRRRSSDS